MRTRTPLAFFNLLLATTALFTACVPSQPGPGNLAGFSVCQEQAEGQTSDGQAVTICKKLFPDAPYVRLPADDSSAMTMYGTVEFDVNLPNKVIAARFIDRNLKEYKILDAAGNAIDENSNLLKKNFLPSNRAHYLYYKVQGVADVNALELKLSDLAPVIMVEGKALDERFLGAWEGTMTLRSATDVWYNDNTHVAKVRVEFTEPLIPHTNFGELKPDLAPLLPDATRFKAIGTITNAKNSVMLSTGECAPSLESYGAQNPIPVDNYTLKMWRFPAMHTLWTKDFHVVINYPEGLYPYSVAMASDNNFRLKDYASPATSPRLLNFGLHGNPFQQLNIMLKPVKGGGGSC